MPNTRGLKYSPRAKPAARQPVEILPAEQLREDLSNSPTQHGSSPAGASQLRLPWYSKHHSKVAVILCALAFWLQINSATTEIRVSSWKFSVCMGLSLLEIWQDCLSVDTFKAWWWINLFAFIYWQLQKLPRRDQFMKSDSFPEEKRLNSLLEMD